MTAAESDPGHDSSKCGARKRQGDGYCKRPAGWGTSHAGEGCCKLHGGATASHREAASEALAREAVITYGLPRDISPTDALLEEVRYAAGHVAWLREQVATLERESLVWGVTEETEKNATEFAGTDTTRAAAMNMWLELYHKERRYLLDVTKAAISAGVEERRVKLAEAAGAELNGILRRIFARLALSPQQSALLPLVVPEEIRRAMAMASAN
jgi:hypothetical protein